ncbi:hypothetical protein C8Q80DRAFT_1219859 [Daedaleopsis nitida]|nr:hypothetical protein C8Q80DRAFT_1219859 [Daedaleopsis nitida]
MEHVGHPSEGWLLNLVYIDGGRNPPQFYADVDESNANHAAAGYPPVVFGPPPIAGPSHAPLAQAVPPPQLEAATPNTPANKKDDPPCSLNTGSARHLVSMTVLYTVAAATGCSTRGSTKKSKPKKTCKSDHIWLETASWAEFIQAALAIHKLGEQYCSSAHPGLAMKVWWTGSGGGKSGASVTDTDHEFKFMHTKILRCNKGTCKVNAEFDLDGMEGYCIRKRPLTALDLADNDKGLNRGDKHHLGEHGEPGHCYIDAIGKHLGLNMCKLKLREAAIMGHYSSDCAAYDAIKHHTPNKSDFGYAWDGRASVAHRPRLSGDMTALLMAAMLPLITSQLAPKPPSTPSCSRIAGSPTAGTLHTPVVPVACLCGVMECVEGWVRKF